MRTLQEMLHFARKLCQEQELLANLPGAMLGMPLANDFGKGGTRLS